MKKILNAVTLLIILVGYVAMAVCSIIFLIVDREIISGFPIVCALAAIVLALPLVGCSLLYKKRADKAGRTVGIVLTVLAIAVSIVCYLCMFVYVALQPYINTGFARKLFPYAVFTFLFGVLCLLFVRKDSFLPIVLSLTVLCMAIISGGWIFFQPNAEYENAKRVESVFVGGEDDYNTFRIPSLSVIPKDVLSEKLSIDASDDFLIAVAEGRKNNAGDEGEIDLVMKTSFDGGKTWSPLKKVFAGEKVKFGNPTPIVDRETGDFHLVYIVSDAGSGYVKYKLYDSVGRLRPDRTFEWLEPVEITFPGARIALCAGPGRGVCLSDGRLVFACYENYSDAESVAFLVMSSDHGKTWTRTDFITKGNECDVVELNDHSLLFVCRSNEDCSAIHLDRQQRFYHSSDGGVTWKSWETNTPLRTPICQCAFGNFGEEIFLTYPDCYETRANLSVSLSEDGKTFRTLRLYNGPSGYSSAATTSDGDVCVLAEVGRLNYYERIDFIQISKTVAEKN